MFGSSFKVILTKNKKISLILESILETRIDSGSGKLNITFIGQNRFRHATIDSKATQRESKHRPSLLHTTPFLLRAKF